MTNVHMPTENGRTARDDQHWLWTVHCPDCLTTKSLVREDFDGAPKIVFRCSTCGYEKELENPEQPSDVVPKPAAVTPVLQNQ